MKKGAAKRPHLRVDQRILALLLAQVALVLAGFTHLALAILLLLLTTALAGAITTLLAALFATLLVLVCHLTLLSTLSLKAAIKRLRRPSVPFVTVNG